MNGAGEEARAEATYLVGEGQRRHRTVALAAAGAAARAAAVAAAGAAARTAAAAAAAAAVGRRVVVVAVGVGGAEFAGVGASGHRLAQVERQTRRHGKKAKRTR